MKTRFDLRARSIAIRVTIVGPHGPFDVPFVLDTGAERTIMSRLIAEKVGIDVASLPLGERIRTLPRPRCFQESDVIPIGRPWSIGDRF